MKDCFEIDHGEVCQAAVFGVCFDDGYLRQTNEQVTVGASN